MSRKTIMISDANRIETVKPGRVAIIFRHHIFNPSISGLLRVSALTEIICLKFFFNCITRYLMSKIAQYHFLAHTISDLKLVGNLFYPDNVDCTEENSMATMSGSLLSCFPHFRRTPYGNFTQTAGMKFIRQFYELHYE